MAQSFIAGSESVSQRQLARRAIDRPSHAIFTEVLPLHAIDPQAFRPLKRVEYERLVDLGAFEDEKVELLYGTIVQMSPIGEPHNAVMAKLTELLILALHTRARVRPASSFAAGDISEPEPDLLVVPRIEFPGRPDTGFLVIEISESSLRTDRKIKKTLYAESGIPEYWIVNLIDHVIEVHDSPASGKYTRSKTYSAGESIRIGAFPQRPHRRERRNLRTHPNDSTGSPSVVCSHWTARIRWLCG